MVRLHSLPLVCILLLSGCLFNSEKDGPTNNATDMSDEDAAAADMASDLGGPDLPIDQGSADLGRPDATTDMGPEDVGAPDMSVDMEPDMPPAVAPSAVCVGSPTSQTTGAVPFRLRLESTDARLFAGYIIPGDNAWLLSHSWSQWESGTPFWVSVGGYAGILNDPDALEESEATGIAVYPRPDTGLTGVFVTRRNNPNCLHAEYSPFMGTLACGAAWGAEVTNLDGDPRYFWFGEDGTIASMPFNDLSPNGQQIVAPWCARDSSDPTSCLTLEFAATDARANRGPYVLLSDAEGRAYVWDSVQNIDGSAEAIDCTTPPTAPVPLLLQGNPVMFDRADLVRANGENILVHQTDDFVRLHRLDSNLQPMASHEQLENSGLRPLFDAASDGTRIAAAAGIGSDVRLFAFGPSGSIMDEVADDDDTLTMLDLGVSVRQDQVAIMVATDSTFFAAAIAHTMWTN